VTVLSATAPGAGQGLAVAHAIHYAIVAAGIVGILALLLPQLLERVLGTPDSRPRPPRPPRDAHEARILTLRAQAAAGTLGTTGGTTPGSTRGSLHEAVTVMPALPVAARTLLPLGFVASTAAAGVHAAMAPVHLEHQLAGGLFFLAAAVLQAGWAGAVVLGVSRRLAAGGALVNLALVGLWALTRTVGLPGLPPEPVGPWDLACVAWELTVVVVCLRLLGPATRPAAQAPPGPLVPWDRWDGRVAAFAVGSAAVLAALSFSGFSG
jgi:hypothetical protein